MIDPAARTDPASFKARVSAYAASLRATRPEKQGMPVRVPLERSISERERRLADGFIAGADGVDSQVAKAADHHKEATGRFRLWPPSSSRSKSKDRTSLVMRATVQGLWRRRRSGAEKGGAGE